MNRKILFLINKLNFGGAETVFINDANILHERGCQVYFAILYGDKNLSPLLSNLKIPNENIFFINSKNLLDFGAYIRFNKFLRKLGSLVLFATLNDSIFFSRFHSILNNKINLFIREANVAYPKPKIFKLFDMTMNIWVKGIVVVSKEVGESLVTYQPWLKNKIKVLYNGVFIPSEKSKNRENMVILANGSLTPKKDFKTLIKAFKAVLGHFPQSKLRIIGDGVLRPQLEMQVRELDIENSVTFLGNLKRDKVNEEYKNSSIFVLSSTREGCPNVLLEAMSFGLPSIATKVGAVPEIIENNISGIIIEPMNPDMLSDAIVKILSSSELRDSLGLNASKIIQNNFSMQNHIDSLINILF